MTFIKRLANSLMGTFQKSSIDDFACMRQNTPPDEREVEAIEQAAQTVYASKADRKNGLRGLNVLAPVLLGLLQILPDLECGFLLSSL